MRYFTKSRLPNSFAGGNT